MLTEHSGAQLYKTFVGPVVQQVLHRYYEGITAMYHDKIVNDNLSNICVRLIYTLKLEYS